jgi:hypothetical protein
MDLTKLGGDTWISSSILEVGETSKLTTTSPERIFNTGSSSKQSIHPFRNSLLSPNNFKTSSRLPSRLPQVHRSTSILTVEKPSSRIEILALQDELRDKLSCIEHFSNDDSQQNLNLKELYEPIKDNLIL